MALDIAQLKAAFAKKTTEKSGENTGFWDKFYPFYKMNFGDLVVFRFLPDLDDNNPFGFIVENKYHQLEINGQKKRLACLSMYDEPCPCCEKSREYYTAANSAMGLKFWKKTDYIAQGLVLASPFEYPIKPDENPVRLVSIGKKLHTRIETSIVQGDMEALPFHLTDGYDFRILKTKQGEYADYTSSMFSSKSTPVSEELLGRITLYDLKKFRFAKIEREQMETMIEAFLTGKTYEDEKKVTSETKPVQEASTVIAAATTGTAQAPAPAAQTTVPAAPPAGKKSAAEILAMLKARSTEKK